MTTTIGAGKTPPGSPTVNGKTITGARKTPSWKPNGLLPQSPGLRLTGATLGKWCINKQPQRGCAVAPSREGALQASRCPGMENTLVCLYYHVLARPGKGTHSLPRHNHAVVAAISPHAPPPSAMGSVTPDAGNRSTPFHNGTNPGNRSTPTRNGLPSSRAE